MWRLFLLFIIYSSGVQYLHAANISCSGTLATTAVNIPPANVVLGNGIADYTVLYSVKSSWTVLYNGTCTTGVKWVMSMADLPSGSTVPDQYYNGKWHKIYPTSVSGLGISVINMEPSSNPADILTVPAWPATLYEYVRNGPMGNWFDIYLWKIPGDIPMTGSLAFTGPALYHLFTPVNASDTISSSTLPIMQGNPNYLNWSKVNISGTVNLMAGTCNMMGGSKVVNMGRFDFDGGHNRNSAWVDASFNLDCPKAFGYGGALSWISSSSSGTVSANTLRNNPVRIQIVPRTAVIDASAGILGLDGTGAQGYGIQLAWGDRATLGSGAPAKPVILNSWTPANTINSAYSASAYAIGAPAVSTSADGTIKMAARFVRTYGNTQPGPARAVVEVIASYQ